MYLTRLTISGDPSVQALRQLIDPQATGARADAHHRLVWSAFAGEPDAKRDFLWRHDGAGQFLTLSPHPPGGGALFNPPEVKEFTPALSPGDRLGFALRVNATKAVKPVPADLSSGGKPKRRKRDIVMAALHDVPKGARAGQRAALAQSAAIEWWAGQGGRHGFLPGELVVEGYATHALPSHRGPRKGQPQYGILDLSGVIEVTDPGALIAQIGKGFGRAKAFGCGLMLIRRI